MQKSSFLTVPSPLKTKLKREEVLTWFKNRDGFKDYHTGQSLQNEPDLHLDSPS